MSSFRKKQKRVAAVLVALALLGGTLLLTDLDQSNLELDAPNQVEADASTKKRDQGAKLRMDWFMTLVHRKMFDDAIDRISDEHDFRDSSADAVRVRTLLLEAHEASQDVMSNQLMNALDELDKHIDYIEIDDAVKLHYAAVELRKLRQEYPMALNHANSLVDMLPDSAEALETRAECFEILDKDSRNLRGHFERAGIDREAWRIIDGKEKAIQDLASSIELEDTLGRRIKRARVEAELFRFNDAWQDMKVAESMAKTIKDNEWIQLATWALQIREKEARRIAAL